MKILLDTHAFLWFVTGDRRFSRKVRRLIERDGAVPLISVASVWEIAIKHSLGRLKLPVPVADYIEEKLAQGFSLLPLEWIHAAEVAELPLHHRDPFDRILIAQARLERLPLATADRAFKDYDVRTVW
ncbi:MAG: type II toxin-antitoxin system VapC family toxin [Deltaproteobacteria bacterium]|nr:MAG: type II toxin-antitoxin system VapC family toxin [Deltaproteobacteria bacterium]